MLIQRYILQFLIDGKYINLHKMTQQNRLKQCYLLYFIPNNENRSIIRITIYRSTLLFVYMNITARQYNLISKTIDHEILKIEQSGIDKKR